MHEFVVALYKLQFSNYCYTMIGHSYINSNHIKPKILEVSIQRKRSPVNEMEPKNGKEPLKRLVFFLIAQKLKVSSQIRGSPHLRYGPYKRPTKRLVGLSL